MRIFKCSLPNITCINCVQPAINALTESKKIKVTSVKPDVPAKTITIMTESSANKEDIIAILREEIEDVGVDCDEFMELKIEDAHQGDKPKISKRKLYLHIVQGAVGVAVGATLMGLAFAGMDIPMLGMYITVGFSSALTLALGLESYRDGVKHLVLSRTMTMDLLYSVSTLTIIGTSIGSFFVPWLPMTLEAGVLIFGFKHIGKAIEEAINYKIAVGLSLKERATEKVICVRDGVEFVVSSEDIQVDDLIHLRAGEILPVNGQIEMQQEDIESDAWIYKTIVNGNMLPERMKHGDLIPAGARIPQKTEHFRTDHIYIRVTHTMTNSLLAKRELQSAAIEHKEAPIEATAARILRYFIPGVFAAAGVAGVVVGVVMNPALGIQCGTAVLVSACPCTFGFIIPLAIKLGMTKAENLGVRFKTSHAVQEAAEVNAVLFDLNGTLTNGLPEVTGMMITNPHLISEQELLGSVLAMESEVEHPIANIIREYVDGKYHHKVEMEVTRLDKSNHAGVSAVIGDHQYAIGSRQLMQAKRIDLPDEHDNLGTSQFVYVAKNNQLAGYFKIEDRLRNDAIFALNELRSMGIEAHMVTGAAEATALRYAAKLNIPPALVFAGCDGESDDPLVRKKIDYVTQLKAAGKKVSMVGDGGNDELAVKASFGIAMNSTALDQKTYEHAGAVVENACLLPVVTAFAAGRQTIRSAKINMGLSLLYNMAIVLIAGGILLGAGLRLPPAIGVGLMILQMVLITGNQIRNYKWAPFPHLKRYKDMHAEQEMEVVSSDMLFQSRGLQTRDSYVRQHHPDASVMVQELAPAANERTKLLKSSHDAASGQPVMNHFIN